MSFKEADIKDLINSRMNQIAQKFVKNNKNLLNNREAAQVDNFATQRKMKAYGRQVDGRIDDVLNEHSRLMSKLNYLV